MKELDEIEEEKNFEKKEESSQQLLNEKKTSQEQTKKEVIQQEQKEQRETVFYQNPYEFYDDKKNKEIYEKQRHLLDRNVKKQNPLVDITKKEFQTEYIFEVNYILKKLFIIFFLSILIFIETFIITRNYKLYNYVALSQIFSAFTFFNAFFLIVELYRDALRDQLRHNLYRLFSIFLFIFFICLFVSESLNIYTIHYKIEERNQLCKQNISHCGDKNINNILFVFNCVNGLGMILIAYFPIWLGLRSFKILIGCDYEVIQKQLLENFKNLEKSKLNNIKEKSENSKIYEKGHLKNE